MKVGELRVLEDDELGTRLKTARRELYELRFKHAVGQLDNASQIAQVRHNIARILTVLNERELGISTIQIAEPVDDATTTSAPKKAKPKRKEFVDEEDEQTVEASAEETPEAVAEAEPQPEDKPKRGRKTTKAEK